MNKFKKYFSLVFFVCFLSGIGFAQEKDTGPASVSFTLAECYQLALKQSENIAINKDLIDEAEARFVQALGTLLPHVSLSSTDTKQDKAGLSSANTHTYERKIGVKQTLFSGFKEFSAMSGSRNEKNQRLREKERAEQLLWLDVSGAFYLLIEQQKDLRELEKSREALAERVRDLEDRERIGRSRRSEVVSTQAQLYSAQAQIESVKGQERVARDLLEFLTGTKINDLREEGEGFPSLDTEEYYLAQAQTRPDVLALKDAWEVAKRQVQIARSDLLPTVNVEANYFLERNTTPRNSDWNAMLTVEIPIFEGTETYGAISQARLQAHQKELELQRGQRTSLLDIRDTYAQTASALAKTQALKKAAEAADENYLLQKEDYQRSLVNNLDVLLAIQVQQQARRDYNQAFYEMRRQYEQLLVAAGFVERETQP